MAMKRKILVVEDNLLNREILTEILVSRYEVIQAENGQEALDILNQNKAGVDLILLDVIMPVMDGYAFLDIIKEDDELSLIPVIVMTNMGNEDDEVEALIHGATDFVPKPYRPQVILQRVANIIKLRESAAMVNQFKYDKLTGVYSKEFFFKQVHEKLLENPEQEYCIVGSNVENFKLYNDTFGVAAGDKMLKEIAVAAQKMVGSAGFCGRFGADRFLCFQEKDKELYDRQNIEPHDGSNRITVNNMVMRWGVYEVVDTSLDVEQMCDRALLAADSIKGQYDRCIAVYDDSLRGKLIRDKAITDAMEKSLLEKQFTVYLQPKYSLKDECIVGAEALVRWIHPNGNIIPPGEFIPLFEKNGFIFQLDKYVCEQVCIMLRDWRQNGHELLPISVNLSRVDVQHADLADYLVELTQRYEIPPEMLHLEITESGYTNFPNQMINTAEELHKKGFIIEMDDFGTGYSSLKMLDQMEVDVLKLDTGFIHNALAKPANQSVLSDIIAMAHKLKLSVVAEGVENREQMKRLRAMGCDYVQGYFIAKPMPVEEFEELWQSQNIQVNTDMLQVSHKKDVFHRLLIVDEDDRYREQVSCNFEGQYHVSEVADADSAIEFIKEHGHNDIDALVLSMTLPGDGAVNIMKLIRQNPAFWSIPVLATVPDGRSTEELKLAMEADDFLCKCHPLFDLKRRVQRMIDIVELYRREVDLEDEANRDHLTGLLNRRGLNQAIASLHNEDLPLAVCMFDLDNLKYINDTRGHDKGDRVIRGFADLLKKQTRSEDIRCRYGGDEFIVILRSISGTEAALKKGNEICQLFSECFAEEEFNASCSGGIVICEIDEKPSEKLIKMADSAMYNAKRATKGSCCLWKD